MFWLVLHTDSAPWRREMVRRLLSVLAFMLLFGPIGASAQTVAVAQLSGTVLDDSGAVLPGVEVTATQTDTGMTRFVITGEKGEYVFTNLQIGRASCRKRVK